MVQFKVKPRNGKGANVVHWCVYVVNQLTDEWIFLKAFFTEQRAGDFIRELKTLIKKGDYSCLTLRT